MPLKRGCLSCGWTGLEDSCGLRTTLLPPQHPAVIAPGFEPQGFPVATRLQHPALLLLCHIAGRGGAALATASHRHRHRELTPVSSLLTIPLGHLQSPCCRAWGVCGLNPECVPFSHWPCSGTKPSFLFSSARWRTGHQYLEGSAAPELPFLSPQNFTLSNKRVFKNHLN